MAVVKDTRKLPMPSANANASNPSASGGNAQSNSSSASQLPTEKLRLFTTAGTLLAEVPWDISKRIIGMGWSDLENLMIVLDDGELYGI